MNEESDNGRAFRVVVGVTGGIAAYKAVQVVRDLVLAGHHVDVVPTESALRFIGRPTFEAISHNPVTSDLFDDVAEVRHVALGQRADVIAVVPATANSIARLANGLADDLLGTTALASTAPLVIAPAMHTEMWQHPATQANVERLAARGAIIVGPDSGQLTGDDVGPGRLAESETIVSAIERAAGRADASRAAAARSHDLAGRTVLVTAGGTREPLDPVRFLGNRSSGRQGVAIAARAAARGADVTLVAANLEVGVPDGVHVVEVSTAAQMAETCAEIAPRREVIIMAAAVADYRPDRVSDSKIKKEQSGDELTIAFTKNPDILRDLSAARVDGQIIVGFAAETAADDDELLELGRAKIARKGCDYLAVNRVGWHEGFQRDENSVVILAADGDVVRRHEGDKMSVADAILDVVAG
ncbi:phosphopantothenoylcysteine decarboxylase [Pseudoclavibacter endophyticus]|uniref:Coenzyme A biosynthesis bifunctional protein CoaBC n=1 Tax=Pseudoclavibacter endophyticus TaxID=1778590 RepID=A0A6H9WUD2_9MICO|nr:bifunctional phosphopantothenoylcysteine decarboxylase/phosphopantothenate--cysteine ligase CoaBC [Pseudoclavibacter endophyticus]KAB1650094.1 bifunctional phosphopantothenoylcysteine decarboxylase/phosphopantothenate--cysteine ligase CoaBC [Pseudoclavibacter endophyticus]GGA57318.1 phosphopantothenoylcysteine decarboxylase [Pseudoclavibacter endophyticus]